MLKTKDAPQLTGLIKDCQALSFENLEKALNAAALLNFTEEMNELKQSIISLERDFTDK